MNQIKILIFVIFVVVFANLKLSKPNELQKLDFTNIAICEVVYNDPSVNQTPFVIVRNPYKDTLWVFTSDLYNEPSRRLVARRMIAFKDTITNIEAYMGIESSPMEMLTPICPLDSTKFSTYFSKIEEIKHYNNNKILYEFEYFFKKGKNFEKYKSRTYYYVDSNSYHIYNSKNDSTGILFEDRILKMLKMRNDVRCGR